MMLHDEKDTKDPQNHGAVSANASGIETVAVLARKGKAAPSVPESFQMEEQGCEKPLKGEVIRHDDFQIRKKSPQDIHIFANRKSESKNKKLSITKINLFTIIVLGIIIILFPFLKTFLR